MRAPRATATAVRRPAGAYSSAGVGPNRPSVGVARGGGDVHQPGIVADEQRAARQARRPPPAASTRPARSIASGSAASTGAASARSCSPGPGEAPRRARPASARRQQRRGQRDEPLRRPDLAAPVGGRRRAPSPAAPAAAAAPRARGPRARSRPPAAAADRARGWRASCAVLCPVRRAHHRPPPRRHQPGQRRAADIHHQIPTRCRPLAAHSGGQCSPRGRFSSGISRSRFGMWRNNPVGHRARRRR